MNADLLLRCSDYGEGIKNECSNAINSASYAHIAVDVPNALNHLLLSLRLFSQAFFVRFSLLGRSVSFRFWAPTGFYKSEESAVTRVLSQNQIERGEACGILPFSPAGSRDDV